MKLKSVFLGVRGRHHVNRVFTPRLKDKIRELTDLYDHIIDRPDLEEHAAKLREIEIAFASWGVPLLSETEIRTYLPNLKALFYAGGTVQDFAQPYLRCGVRLVSGWGANAVPVAEYAASQIILANKGYFQSPTRTKQDYWVARSYAESFPGNYSTDIGILGAGMIGKLVIGFLRKCNLNVLVFDPFLSDAEAGRLGVRRTSLVDVFSHCQTISNHLANKAETIGMLNKVHFSRMLPNATFINTGRGAQLVEQDLIDALKAEPRRSAVLDVTWPEPPAKTSELYTLENVFLTPHIAGSMVNEVERMGVYMLEEFQRYCANEEMIYEVDLEMLGTMA